MIVLPSFLSYTFSFSPNQGSIANFREEDFSFPDELPLQPSQSTLSLTSSHIEPVRVTKGQSDIVELAKLSLPSLTKSHHNPLSDELRTDAETPRQRLDDNDNMQNDPYGDSLSTHSPKHESMDLYQDDIDGSLQKPVVINVPEVAGAGNITLPQPEQLPNEQRGLGDFAAVIDPLSNEKRLPSLLTFNPLIKIDLPPIIREDIIIPVPLNPTGDQVYHIDTLAAPKLLEAPVSPVHYRQQYDPQYKVPPLSVLPAEFSRKTRTAKRKKERERDKLDGKKDKDEVLPMGVNRWGAIVLANPVWKRVSRASKCLSTREWGVCLHNCPNPASTADTLNRLP